jgi:hypothetical protein
VAKALFFEAQPLGVQEATHGVFGNHDPPRGKIRPQFPDRPVRPGGDQTADQIAVRLKNRTAVASVPIRRDMAAGPLALSPTHNRRDGKTEPGRNGTAAATGFKGRSHPLAEIKRIRSNHHMLASFSSQHVESEPDRSGNPKSIQSKH